jgi:hypothetical protein
MREDRHWLYTSRGEPIALEWQGQLHARTGLQVGQFLPQHGIFVDRQGRYLSELAYADRLVVNQASPHRSAYFGRPSSFGTIGLTGVPGPVGPVTLPSGYTDIDPARLDASAPA